jgi:class 3 adenylate cyclase
MATSIPDLPAFIQACSALSDKVGRKPVSIATGPNRAEKLVDEKASARGARILVPGTAADALARSIRCKTLAAESVTLRLRADPLRAANAFASSKRRRREKSHGTVTAEDAPRATLISAETIEAAVLFADMRGYTGLAEQLPPAQVVFILNEFFTMLTRVTVTFGGQVFHMAGDGMMAGFGIRGSRGSGARAALAASHAMLQSFVRVAARWRDEFAVVTGIGIGIGLHVGEVALGFLGPPGKQAITMIGDTANVAARLCSRARAGEVLFSCAVAAALRADADGVGVGAEAFLQLPQFELRGRSELLDIWCVPAPERLAH